MKALKLLTDCKVTFFRLQTRLTHVNRETLNTESKFSFIFLNCHIFISYKY